VKCRVLAGRSAADGFRFVLAGALNTLLTLALYQGLLFFLPPWLAYTFSWIAGLILVVVVYPSRVFASGRRDLLARGLFGGSYAAVFLAGLFALRFLQSIGVPPRISIFAVIVLTTTVNFFSGRLILTRARRG
jgi:putative flippase GtrA